jgi:hypothetical protein
MKTNALKQLAALGQSIWLDYIRRNLIVSGELRRLIEEDGLRGMIARTVCRVLGLGRSTEKGRSDHAAQYIH